MSMMIFFVVTSVMIFKKKNILMISVLLIDVNVLLEIKETYGNVLRVLRMKERGLKHQRNVKNIQTAANNGLIRHMINLSHSL